MTLNLATRQRCDMIACIIPVFKHSTFLNDALNSILQSSGGSDVEIVVVDDGCVHFETMLSGAGYSWTHRNITYLRGPNRGLSGARNVGIEYLLENSAAEAYYFLDADNCISPWSVERMRGKLAERPDGDWFYPDIDMFGLNNRVSYDGPLSPLMLSIENMCEAGSLVRRRVFEAGLRFSKALKAGFEDWDFFLSAVERKFTGVHFPESGFRYRKRPESMLSDADRDRAGSLQVLAKRHPWIEDMRWIVAAENIEAPRYAIFVQDLQAVRLSSGLDTWIELSLDQYAARFAAHQASPHLYAVGTYFITINSYHLNLLKENKLDFWALHDLEKRLETSAITSLSIEPSADEFVLVKTPHSALEEANAVVMIKMSLMREIILDSAESWIRTALDGHLVDIHTTRVIQLPALSGRPVSIQTPGQALRYCRSHLKRSMPEGVALVARLQPFNRIAPFSRSDLTELLRHKFKGGLLPPHFARKAKAEIAFVLPIADFGGVEKVTFAVAEEFKARGYGTSLIILKSQKAVFFDAVHRYFDRVVFLDDQTMHDWGGPPYLGTPLSNWSIVHKRPTETNLLGMFDAVISAHGHDILGLMGDLKRLKVVTASYIHLFDRNDFNRRVGHPTLALAYEHAIDLIIGCSNTICSEIHAEGVPAEKIVCAPNATSSQLSVTPEFRDVKQGSKPLNVLFIGRLDHQKGLQRLRQVIRSLSGNDNIVCRVIGKALVGESQVLDQEFGTIEPPVYDESKLIDIYRWADVLLLPSGYEGLPLTLIESMRIGVVPIATRVGANHEAVTDGVDGHLFEKDDYVERTVARLIELAGHRDALREMSNAATKSSSSRSWSQAVDAIEERLVPLMKSRRPDFEAPELPFYEGRLGTTRGGH